MVRQIGLPIAAVAVGLLSIFSGPSRAEEEKVKPANREVVKHIKKAECRESGADLVVTVVAGIPNPGYENVQLVRVVYDSPPADGFQDFILLAMPPKLKPNVVSDLEATAVWKDYRKGAPWIKGVRIYGSDDFVTVRELPKGK